jgi:hypothetical protein
MIKELLDQARNFSAKGEYYAAFSHLAHIEKLALSSMCLEERGFADEASKLSFDALAFEKASKKLMIEVGRLQKMLDHSNNLDLEEVLLMVLIRVEATLVNIYIEKHGGGAIGGSASLNLIDGELWELARQSKQRQKFIEAGALVTKSMGLPISVHSPFLQGKENPGLN